jgi:hypothetical protein
LRRTSSETGTVFGDLERRRLRFVEQTDVARENLDFAGGELWIHRIGRTPLHHAGDADDELGSEPLGDGHERVVLAHHDLRDPRAIADVEKRDAPQIADAMHPSQHDDVVADILRAESSTRMSSLQIAEMFCHSVNADC